MPLEVTAGPQVAAPGSGPPGVAGVVETAPPTGDPGVPFAALLAQQTQPILVAQAKPSDPVPAKTTEKSTTKDDDTESADPQPAAQSAPSQMTVDWTALAAQQSPQPSLLQTNAPPTGDTPVKTAPTLSTEVMDTVSPSAPLAVPAKTATASSELLPPSTIPQTPSAAPQAVPVTGAVMPVPAAVSQTTVLAPQAVPSVTPVTSPITTSQMEPMVLPASLGNAVDSQSASVPSTSVPRTPVSVASPAVPTSIPAAVPLPVVASSDPQLPTPVAVSAPGVTPPASASGGGGADGSPAPPVAVPAQSQAPVAALPTAPPTNSVSANQTVISQTVAPVQITLQNLAVPANNTGKSDALRPVITPPQSVDASEDADSDGVTGEGQIGIVLPKRFAAAAVATGQEAETVQTKAARSAGQTAAFEKTKPAAQDTHKPEEESNDLAAAPPQPTVGTDSSSGQVAGTASAEKPLTGAERAQVIRQAADGVSAVKPQVLTGGQGQMTLQLHPKEWGDLRVTVQLAPAQPLDGVKQTAVVAHVVASSPAVKSALETHSADLNQALRETGLRLDRLTVTVQAPGASSHSGGAASDSQGFSQRNQEQSQATSSQGGAGNNLSSFASFSERQDGRQLPTQASSASGQDLGDEGDTGSYPGSNYTTRQSAGFDRRA